MNDPFADHITRTLQEAKRPPAPKRPLKRLRDVPRPLLVATVLMTALTIGLILAAIAQSVTH